MSSAENELNRLLEPEKKPKPKQSYQNTQKTVTVSLNVQQVIDKLQSLNKWNVSVGEDWSATDLAFCNDLAFYCGRDYALMDEVFRQSTLIRDKWDVIHDRTNNRTYGQMTLEKAIEDTQNIYDSNYSEVEVTSTIDKNTLIDGDPFDDIEKEGLEMSFDDFESIANQKYLIDRFIPCEALSMFAGDAGTGKSAMGYAVAKKTLDENPEYRCLFLDIDSGALTNKRRVLYFQSRYGTKRFKYLSQFKRDVNAEDLIVKLIKWSQMNLANTLFIIDSLSSFIVKGSIKNDDHVKPFMNILEQLRNRGATVILINHVTKAKDEKGQQDYVGSFVIKKALDVAFVITKADKVISCRMTKDRIPVVSRAFEIENFHESEFSDVDYISVEDEAAAKKEIAFEIDSNKIINYVMQMENSNKDLSKTDLEEWIVSNLKKTVRNARSIINKLVSNKDLYENRFTDRNKILILLGYARSDEKNKDTSITDDGSIF